MTPYPWLWSTPTPHPTKMRLKNMQNDVGNVVEEGVFIKERIATTVKKFLEHEAAWFYCRQADQKYRSCKFQVHNWCNRQNHPACTRERHCSDSRASNALETPLVLFTLPCSCLLRRPVPNVWFHGRGLFSDHTGRTTYTQPFVAVAHAYVGP